MNSANLHLGNSPPAISARAMTIAGESVSLILISNAHRILARASAQGTVGSNSLSLSFGLD
jgi:hypothetical protein